MIGAELFHAERRVMYSPIRSQDRSGYPTILQDGILYFFAPVGAMAGDDGESVVVGSSNDVKIGVITTRHSYLEWKLG